MASQIDRPADADWQIGINLDLAVSVTLIIVVAAPGLSSNEFQLESLVRREADMLQRSPATFRNRCLHYRFDPGGWDVEPIFVGINPVGQRPVARNQNCDARQDRRISGQGLDIRHRAEQAARLLNETRFFTG